VGWQRCDGCSCCCGCSTEEEDGGEWHHPFWDPGYSPELLFGPLKSPDKLIRTGRCELALVEGAMNGASIMVVSTTPLPSIVSEPPHHLAYYFTYFNPRPRYCLGAPRTARVCGACARVCVCACVCVCAHHVSKLWRFVTINAPLLGASFPQHATPPPHTHTHTSTHTYIRNPTSIPISNDLDCHSCHNSAVYLSLRSGVSSRASFEGFFAVNIRPPSPHPPTQTAGLTWSTLTIPNVPPSQHSPSPPHILRH
jgi:hypothetical protein